MLFYLFLISPHVKNQVFQNVVKINCNEMLKIVQILILAKKKQNCDVNVLWKEKVCLVGVNGWRLIFVTPC